MTIPDFELLSPSLILRGLELSRDLSLTDSLMTYPSYVNRVYGIRDRDGVDYVAKFYRPGRWTWEAVREEHRFLEDCIRAEIPVVAPLADSDGETVGEITAVDPEEGRETVFLFALFPLKGGRQFDAEGEEDWLRLGSLLGRLHRTGKERKAPSRMICTPETSTEPFIRDLLEQNLVHPQMAGDFRQICGEVLDQIRPLFRNLPLFRIHGDCHRGNILDRSREGLLLIDFDDMMTGPAMQDMWLLLPDYAEESYREISLLTEGYEQFLPFPRGELKLLEPLRFMRMIYYLHWCARQREDSTFLKHFPDWGSRSFWLKEVEDLRLQAERIDRWISRDTFGYF